MCKDVQNKNNAANLLLTPFRYMKWFLQWAVGRASWLIIQTQLAHIVNPDWAYSMEQEQQADYHYEETDMGPGMFYFVRFE